MVDDERLARQRLKASLAKIDDVKLVAEASSGIEALEAIEKFDPAVVLLDIEMPEGDGFEVVTRVLQQSNLPEIIFITAFNSYAVKAYEHGASDYLLKPFTENRLREALLRVGERIRLRTVDERVVRLQQTLRHLQNNDPASRSNQDIWFRRGTEDIRVFKNEIQYVSADRDYVEVTTSEKVLHLRLTVMALERQLGKKDFIRIHRSHIVRKAAIRALRRKRQSKAEVELVDGKILPVGASYLDDVNSFIADRQIHH